MRRTAAIRRQSSKQASNLREWAKLKREEINRQIDEQGYVVCADPECGKRYYTVESALAGLHADHIVSGHGREWTAENMQLLCSPNNGSLGCHLGSKHGQ